jgi:two-component system chemotaxis response regulator CheY
MRMENFPAGTFFCKRCGFSLILQSSLISGTAPFYHGKQYPAPLNTLGRNRMANKIKILVVEDEFISRTLLMEMLSPFGDCEAVTNGREAVDVLEKSYSSPANRYDLVCLDIMMPKMNGHEVLREMRRIETAHGVYGAGATKVLMVTALDDAENIMQALVEGRCQAYLTKPISRARLEEQLRHLRLIENIV